MEGEIVGSNVGDQEGRIYLRQAGTGVVHGVDGVTRFYVFEPRTAVIDVLFNGNRRFDPSVYRSVRMKERPLLNTNWELVINQRDELANQDIDLDSLTDIRLYVYYADFTIF